MSTYCELKNFINSVVCDEKGAIGKTESGRDIPYIFFGRKDVAPIIVQCAIHAREFITSRLAMEQAAELSGREIKGGVYFIPMLNIDGVKLAESGLKFVKDRNKRIFLLGINGGSPDFSQFKANVNGVDLNVNFDCDFGQGRNNVYSPAPENYVGEKPFSESCTRALRDFTLRVKPAVTLSYHTKGEEIYWFYQKKGAEFCGDKKLAKLISRETGYPLKKTPGSTGGYKDWCIAELKIPAFTVEVGNDAFEHPLGAEALPDILKRNKNTVKALIGEIYG